MTDVRALVPLDRAGELEVFGLHPRVNWGRWLVDCPRCDSALTLPPGEEVFSCWDCGIRARVTWPEADFVAGVERLLSMRPKVNTRNWVPGETLHDLLAENVEHGIFDGLSLSGPRRTLIALEGDRVGVDRLPDLPNRITGGPRRAALEA